MKKLLALVLVIALYTIFDSAIWGGIFEPSDRYLFDLKNWINVYYAFWFLWMAGLIYAALYCLNLERREAVLFALSCIVIAHSGLEDILYYLLACREIPSDLPWLNGAIIILFQTPEMPKENIYASSAVWIGIVAITWLIVAWKSKGKDPQ